MRVLFLVCGVLVGLVGGFGSVRAEGILFPAFNESPIDIEAKNGIEWLRNEQRFIARGDVIVLQDDMEVYADVLSVMYDEKRALETNGTKETKEESADDDSVSDTGDGEKGDPDQQRLGGARIVRIEAEGNVYLNGSSGSAYAEKAVYDVVNRTLALSGYRATILHGDTIVRANKGFTYWHDSALAVASGDAQVERGDNLLGGDTLIANFATAEDGDLVLRKVDAYGDVFASDPSQRVTGQQGTYNAISGIADILGNVDIYYGEQYLHGEHARFDFKRGVSRLMAGSQTQRGHEPTQRVRGVFDVEDIKKDRDKDKDNGKKQKE